MASCPYLEYNGSNVFGYGGTYNCSLCNKEPSDQEVKNKCDTDEYEKCPTYKNS